MSTRPNHRRESQLGLNLPPAIRRELNSMGFAAVFRGLKRALRGETTAESRATVRLCNQLHARFDSAYPKLDGELVGSVVVRLVETVEYANGLSQKLGKIVRIKGRQKREQLRSILGGIEEVEVRGLRRQVEGLRRDIPRLLKQVERVTRR